MEKLGNLLAWVFGIIALVFLAAAYGLVWSYKFSVLEYFPAAKHEYKITLDNYDAYQIIVREYRKNSKGKHKLNYFDIISHKVSYKIDGDYMVRYDGRNAFIINRSDKELFDQGEDVNKILVDGVKYSKCVGNAVCSVTPTVTYSYSFKYKTEAGETATTQPYEYDIKI